MSKEFKVGQLACAIIGLSECHPAHNFIGRIASINANDVVLRSFDGEEVSVTLDNLKQAVHYDRDRAYPVAEGSAASVLAIDHPDQYIGQNQMVTTSTVLRHNVFTGFFETKNTLYMANKIDFGLLGVRASPYLAGEAAGA